MTTNRNVLVVGTGFLGEKLYQNISIPFYSDSVLVTHHQDKKYAHSEKFDFFKDDIANILAGRKINLVFISAKIEKGTGRSQKELEASMKRFLFACKDMRVVYISSDGLFDGTKGNYKEDDAISPVTPYGKNLALCEGLIRDMVSNHLVIRPSYLYGYDENGKLDGRLIRARDGLLAGQEMRYSTDVYRSPLSYHQAARIIVDIALSHFVGTVNICGERMSVYDFIKEAMKALNVPTEKLIGEITPAKTCQKEDFLRDASLDNSLMVKLTRLLPMNIYDSFASFYR